MFICIRQLSFGAFCKKIFHKNELQFLPESRALALKKFKKPPHFVPIKKKSRDPACTRLSARVRILLQNIMNRLNWKTSAHPQARIRIPYRKCKGILSPAASVRTITRVRHIILNNPRRSLHALCADTPWTKRTISRETPCTHAHKRTDTLKTLKICSKF